MNELCDSVSKQKEVLVAQGVEKLKILGFSKVTIHTILKDEMYQLYFLSFLNSKSNCNNNEIIAINELKALILKVLKV
ncbi:hypothetical protein [Ulvibacter litoralis]|uniref:Uncharacterized protein n=1 Tax=Ulvibacter litoralis TaxID=227084 RepID=A0A1G7EV95_9FLAO|nr:hypothetical protein [Ulvibacter litoralis]GHC53797.1 hypothetical protein GCM10008083_17380 [Ulvibacter litoralis]SDE67551.1 hypothetical protein SAMN05421855_102160 [Ulvibacter litoralis]